MAGGDEVRDAAEGLRRLLAAVEAGDVDCEPLQLERLRGAEAALSALLETQALR